MEPFLLDLIRSSHQLSKGSFFLLMHLDSRGRAVNLLKAGARKRKLPSSSPRLGLAAGLEVCKVSDHYMAIAGKRRKVDEDNDIDDYKRQQ